MRILFLTYQGFIAGSTFSTFYLARGLAEKGHHVYVGCKSDELLFELLQDTQVKTVAIPFKHRLEWESIKLVKNLVKDENIEIINAQASIDRYVSMIVKKFFIPEVKVVHTRRQRPSIDSGKLHGWIYKWGTDKIVAVSEGVKQEAVRRMGIPEEHLKVIHNGTPPEKYEEIIGKDPQPLLQKYNLPINDKIIGCVSRHKKQEQLLQALQKINDFKTTVIFVGITRDEIELKDREFPQNHNFIFTGRILPHKALEYYNVFNIQVLPSITEGLSQTLLESMYLEVPVIATDAMGNPDLVVHNETGYLFQDENLEEMAQYIRTLFQDKKIYKKMAQKAKERVLEHFTIETVIDNYETFFQELIG